MSRLESGLLKGVCGAVLLLAALWGALGLGWRAPFGESGRLAAGAAFAALGVAGVAGVALRPLRPAAALFVAAFAALLAWWTGLAPSNDRDWAPELARAATAEVQGERLTVANVRDFAWRSETDFTARWERRDYDLATLRDIDLVASYWMGPSIAHTIVSFGFADGRRLAFSYEIRRERGEAFSAVAGFFKTYELLLVAADERDLFGLRQRRGEDMRLFRVRATPQEARAILLAYVADANALARRPRWYDTLTANCTTAIFTLLRGLTNAFPFDWRILGNGYAPEYLWRLGRLDTRWPIADLRRLGAIGPRIDAARDGVAFSAALRAGVPDPN